MHRSNLLQQLAVYAQSTWFNHDLAHQQTCLITINTFIKNNHNCFQRELLSGHLTASCMLLNPARDKYLLTHHRKLGIWIQLGGHADGNNDLLAVAIQEAKEESGLENIVPLSPDIFDIDVHNIPAYHGVAAHIHYDVRYLLQAQTMAKFVISAESINLSWFMLANAEQDLADKPSLLRMAKKLLG